MEAERPVVTWMPALPGFAVTIIVGAIWFIGGTVLAAAAAAYVVLGLVRHRWTPWSWVAVGALAAYAVYWALLALHALF